MSEYQQADLCLLEFEIVIKECPQVDLCLLEFETEMNDRVIRLFVLVLGEGKLFYI